MVELMVAVAIAAVMLVGIGASLRAILVSSANSTNHALAMSEVQKVASWIGDDVVQAQNVSLGDYSNGGFPLIISWTRPQPGNVTYGNKTVTDKLGRNLWELYRTTSSGTAMVAQHLKPFDPTDPLGTTSCSPLRLGNGTLENVLVMNVASQVDAYSASGSYQINPRAFDFTWGALASNTYTLTYLAGANGHIAGDTSQTVSYGGNGTTVEAIPDGNHFFVTWSDGVLTAVRTDTDVTFNIRATAYFGPYTIAASAGAGGSISPSGNVSVPFDGNQAFTITPNAVAHYHVADVLVDGESVGNVTSYQFSNVRDNHDIFASFALDTNTISTTAGAHGTITPANPAVDYGASQTFSITPNTGYHVNTLTVDGVSITPATTYTFSNVIATHTIAATFAINTYTVTPSAGTGGNLTPSTPQTVNYGNTTSFTVTANTGYYIVSVTGCGGTLVGNTYTTGPITGNCTVAATFANTYTITASAGSGGNIAPSGAVVVSYGGNQTFTITANAVYCITNVTVDSVSQGAIGNYTFGNVTSNHTIAATFASYSNTGWNSPSLSAAGAFTNPNNAFSSNNIYADAIAGTSESYANFRSTFTIPSGATIMGIEVRVEANRIGGNTANFDVSLSWNGGGNFTGTKNTGNFGSSDTQITVGGISDTWGRTWSIGDFTDSNFRVRLYANADKAYISLDHVQVRVYYCP